MNWFDLLIDDKPISLYYKKTPVLTNTVLHEIVMHEDGPSISLRFDLNHFADSPPKKWDDSFNTVQVKLNFVDFCNFSMAGWSTHNNVCITMKKENMDSFVQIIGVNLNINFKCKFIYLESVSAYCNEL